MATRPQTLINRQFNTPINLYSPENVADVLNKHAQLLSNGTVGVDFRQLAAPNLANSEVLRMIEEEERQRGGKGYKRVAWPPAPENEPGFQEQPVYSKVPDSISNFTAAPHAPVQGIYNTSSRPTTQTNFIEPLVQTQLYQPSPKAFQPVHFEPPPTTIILRPEPPIHQEPPPVFSSQPAATKALGPKMRGDEKWPPATYKAQAAAENAARVALAKGPAVRPRKVKKDYSSFFAQNALNSNYPSYRAPPGTQHYIEEGTSNL